MDQELLKFEWGIEIVLNGLRRVTKTHLVAPVRTKPVNVALRSEGKCVAVAAAHSRDFVEDVLDASRFANKDLRPEDAVSQTQLPLAIVTKGVEVSNLGHESRDQVAALNLRDRMRGLKDDGLRHVDVWNISGILAALTLLIAPPRVDLSRVGKDNCMVGPAGNPLGPHAST